MFITVAYYICSVIDVPYDILIDHMNFPVGEN
jgi:hypothetical protein